MKYQSRPITVEAVQWFKHGDHPGVRDLTDTPFSNAPSLFVIGNCPVLWRKRHKPNTNSIPKSEEDGMS
jgi:hypothetical protein